jgi:hypothetical protein
MKNNRKNNLNKVQPYIGMSNEEFNKLTIEERYEKLSSAYSELKVAHANLKHLDRYIQAENKNLMGRMIGMKNECLNKEYIQHLESTLEKHGILDKAKRLTNGHPDNQYVRKETYDQIKKERDEYLEKYNVANENELRMRDMIENGAID